MAFPLTNLRAYYKLDETGTGNASDTTGNGYTLTNNGPWTYATAKINNGFDGGSANSTKWGKNATSLGMDMTTNFTANFWLNVTTQPGSGVVATPIRWEDSSTANKMGNWEFQMYNNAGTQQVYLRRNDSAGADQSAGDNSPFASTGTWYMCTLTWDGSNYKFYLNASGTATSTVASTRTGTNTPASGAGTFFEIGCDDANGRCFSGLIDEVGIWSSVLSSADITALYNGGAGLAYPAAASNNGAGFFMMMA